VLFVVDEFDVSRWCVGSHYRPAGLPDHALGRNVSLRPDYVVCRGI
jgi:hypothetical protein